MSMKEIHVPIAPQIEQGTISVKIRTITQIARQDFSVDVEILVRKDGIDRSHETLAKSLVT